MPHSPPSPSGMVARNRYTVVYEGDPSGVKILSGERAPGEAVTVGLGDAFADLIQAGERCATAAAQVQDANARVVALAVERAELLKALRQLNAFARKAATLDYSEDITIMGIAHYTAHVDALIAKAEAPSPTIVATGGEA